MIRVTRWAFPALAAMVAATLAWPTFAQRGGDQSADDVVRAKEMARLIQEGQLNLRDATTMAEQHSKGVALEASCEIKSGLVEQPKGDGSEDPAQASAQRLVYEVSCFANEKIMTIRVDGLNKKVIDAKDRPSPGGSGTTP